MDILISILLVVIGLGAGAATVVVSNNMKENNAKNKADKIIENARKDAEKVKRDSLFEPK